MLGMRGSNRGAEGGGCPGAVCPPSRPTLAAGTRILTGMLTRIIALWRSLRLTSFSPPHRARGGLGPPRRPESDWGSFRVGGSDVRVESVCE